MPQHTFSQPTYAGPQALLAAIARDDVDELAAMIVAAALNEEDRELLQGVCGRLAAHPEETVRGNAILCFGHVARRFGALDEPAFALVRRALQDESSYVRGQAHAAAGDLRHFLGIDVRVASQ